MTVFVTPPRHRPLVIPLVQPFTHMKEGIVVERIQSLVLPTGGSRNVSERIEHERKRAPFSRMDDMVRGSQSLCCKVPEFEHSRELLAKNIRPARGEPMPTYPDCKQ